MNRRTAEPQKEEGVRTCDVWNEVMPVINKLLRRINSLNVAHSVTSPIDMRILDTVALKPKLYLLLLASGSGVEGILEKVKPVRAVDIRLPDQENRFTVEFYTDTRTSFAVVLHHKNNRVTLFHVFADFIAEGAEDICPTGLPAHNSTSLANILIYALEALRAGREIGCDCSLADCSEFSSVVSGGVMLPPPEEESRKSEK